MLSGGYRRVAAFRADAALLRDNCLQFNEARSALARGAHAVFRALAAVADVADAEAEAEAREARA